MQPNIVIVGCGAIAQAFYLPALASLRSILGDIWLVDPSERALSVAESIVPGKKAHRLADVDGQLHIVIVASPNKFHFELAMEALSRNAHVLLEKPFVIWPEQGRTLIDAAAKVDRLIGINQTRRLFPVAQALHRSIAQGEFGRLKSIVHREGSKFAWPFESGAGFSKEAQRTGVLMDFGVHVIDFYQYLLGPKWKFVSAIHDGFQGPEGLAEVELLANDVTVSIRLSRYYLQNNLSRMAFDHAEVVLGVYDDSTYTVRSNDGAEKVIRLPGAANTFAGYGRLLLLNLFAAIEKREALICAAEASLPVIDVLDETYLRSRRYSAQLGCV